MHKNLIFLIVNYLHQLSMKKPKILVSCLAAVHILHAATILQGIELLSSHEAWTQLGVQASSSNGKQNNTYKNGGFVKWGGGLFFL